MHGRAFDYRYTFVRIIHPWFCCAKIDTQNEDISLLWLTEHIALFIIIFNMYPSCRNTRVIYFIVLQIIEYLCINFHHLLFSFPAETRGWLQVLSPYLSQSQFEPPVSSSYT